MGNITNTFIRFSKIKWYFQDENTILTPMPGNEDEYSSRERAYSSRGSSMQDISRAVQRAKRVGAPLSDGMEATNERSDRF